MKRSLSEELPIENKQIKIESNDEETLENSSESSCSSSETSCSSSETSTETFEHFDLEPFTQDFIPSNIEKQIVAKSLAIICRSNMNDWNLLIGEDEREMILCELGVLYNDDDFLSCNITVNVKYNEHFTFCDIFYLLKNGKTQILQLQWDEEYDNIYICKTVYEKYLLIFNTEISQTYETCPRDCEEDSWCYFQDARRHLNRIKF